MIKKRHLQKVVFRLKASDKLSASEVRRVNRNRVYMYLYGHETPKTKRDIEQSLEISMPTVTQNLKELLKENLIAYVGTEESTGGRKARQIAVNPAARFAVGIEISPKHIRYVAVDLRANEIAFTETEQPFRDDAPFYAYLAAQLELFLDKFALERANLLGIGITVPGIVDTEQQAVTIAPVLEARRISIRRMTERIPYPCFVQNDASAGGVAEGWLRSRTENMAYLFLGKGVGGALLLDGKPYMGAHGRSAEFGHTCVHPGGAPCNCGKRGCLEAYCSTARLTDDLGKRTEEFFRDLQAGREEEIRVWNRYLDYLALGIYNIRMTLDCDVLLGGVISPFLADYLPDLKMRLQKLNAFESETDYLQVGACGSKANCIGVALHFIKQFIEQV